MLGPAIIAALRHRPGTADEIADRLCMLTDNVLCPDGDELYGTLTELRRAAMIEQDPASKGAEVRAWRLTAQCRVRLLGIAERLHQRARLTERIAAVLEDSDG